MDQKGLVPNTGRSKGKWSVDTTKLLVSFYEQQPSLYERSNPNYRNKTVRQKALSTIAQQLKKCTSINFTMEDVQLKINGIRTQFSVVHNNKTKTFNQSHEHIKPSWWLYEHLQFLIPHFKVQDKTNMRLTQQTINNNLIQNRCIERSKSLDHNDIQQNNSSELMEYEDDESDVEEVTIVEEKLEKPSISIIPRTSECNNYSAINNNESKEKIEILYHSPKENLNSVSNDMAPIPDPIKIENNNSDDKDDYLNVNITHLKYELASLKNVKTQRLLLRQMFQLVYDAQDKDDI